MLIIRFFRFLLRVNYVFLYLGLEMFTLERVTVYEVIASLSIEIIYIFVGFNVTVL